MRNLTKLFLASIVAGALTLAVAGSAQSTNKAAAERKASTAEKKPGAHPFHGKLTSIDKSAKTITVGKTNYHVSSETKMKKDGKPATLEDGVIDEGVTGYVKPNEEGKMVASSVNFGGKSGSSTKKPRAK